GPPVSRDGICWVRWLWFRCRKADWVEWRTLHSQSDVQSDCWPFPHRASDSRAPRALPSACDHRSLAICDDPGGNFKHGKNVGIFYDSFQNGFSICGYGKLEGTQSFPDFGMRSGQSILATTMDERKAGFD